MMLITVATGIGLQHKIREKISVFKGHVQISNFDNNHSEATQNPIFIQQDFYPEFSDVSGVTHIQVFATKAGLIRTATDFEGIVLKGVGADYDWSGIEEYLIAGELPVLKDSLSNKVLLSKLLANRLGLEPGSRFDTYFMKDNPNKMPNRRVFEVAGIYNSGFKEFDESVLIGDMRHIQKMNKWHADQVGGFEVFLEDFEKIQEKGSEIYTIIDASLDSRTIVELFPAIFDWLKLFDTNIFVIIGIMILVAGINMITALLVLILERTQTIGVLKSIGASNWSIRKIFMYNASYLIFRGLLIGNSIGLMLLFVQHYFGVITLDPETYYVSEAPVYLNIWHVVLLNVGTLVLCFVMLILPSYIITKISPAKSVKFA